MKLAVMEQDFKMKDEQLMRVAEELSFERDTKVFFSVCLSISLFSVCSSIHPSVMMLEDKELWRVAVFWM